MQIRSFIDEILKANNFNVYPISPKKGLTQKPYLVLRFTDSKKSTNNSLGLFIYFEVLVYVPQNSITPMAKTIEKVQKALGDVAEFTGRVTQDYYDDIAQAYMRSLEFRIATTID